MSRRRVSAFFLSAALFWVILGCDYKGTQKMNTKATSPVEISINIPGDRLKEKYPALVSVNRQPAGLSFFKMTWSSNNKGIVRLTHGAHTFDFSDVLSLLGTQDDEQRKPEISEFTIICGISGVSGISHSAARDRFFGIIDRLEKAGWKSTVRFSAPRLSGKDMMKYRLESGESVTLASDYIPTIDEWMKLEDLSTWEFYADGVFLRMNFLRDEKKLDPSKPGAYIINFNIQSDIEYFKSFVDPDHREEWQTFLPESLKESLDRRQLREESLRKKGFKINTDYKDPPLPKP